MMNPKFRENAKNKGVVPTPRDNRLRAVSIPCGWCKQCVRAKRKEWRNRLKEEAIMSPYGYGYFVTLSISEERMDKLVKDAGDNANKVAALAVRRWTERWRQEKRKPMRHWMVTEIGQNNTERVHLHGIVWGTKKEVDEMIKKWGYGNVWVERSRGEMTVNYVVKYLTKKDEKHPGFKGRMLASKGLGKAYVESNRAKRNAFKEGGKTDTGYYTIGKKEGYLNQYWRKKLYSDEEREEIRIGAMDEGTIWIGGELVKKDDELKWLRRWIDWATEERERGIREGYPMSKKRVQYTARGGNIIREAYTGMKDYCNNLYQLETAEKSSIFAI